MQTREERVAESLRIGAEQAALRANGQPVLPHRAKPRHITSQPLRVSVAIRTRLQREFGIGCTTCFNATLAQLDKLSIAAIRQRTSEFANSIRENAHEMESVKGRTDGRQLTEWAKANGGEAAYQRIVTEACDACDIPEQPECTDADIVVASGKHGFGDGVILSYVAEGAKLQGIKIAHYATGKKAELLSLFGQEITRDDSKALRIEPIYTKLSRLHGRASYMDLYCEWLGVDKIVQPRLIKLPSQTTEWAERSKATVLLFPQCTRVIRTWPQTYWLLLQSELRRRGFDTKIVLWGEYQSWQKCTKDLFVDLSWSETVALIQLSKAVFGNNSGCVHVAGALDVTTFVISGLTTKESLGGFPTMHHIAVDKAVCSCVGCCYSSPRNAVCDLGCFALQVLTPQMVLSHPDVTSVLQ